MADETQMPNGITKALDNSRPSSEQWSEFLVDLTKQNVDEVKKIGGSLDDYLKYFKPFEDVKKNIPIPEEDEFNVPLDSTGKVSVADPGLKANTSKLGSIHSVLQSIDKHLGVTDKLKAIPQPLVSKFQDASSLYGSTLGDDSPGRSKNLTAAGEKAKLIGSTLARTSLDLAMTPITGILKPFEDMFKFSTTDLMMKGLGIPGTLIKKQLARRKNRSDQAENFSEQEPQVAPPIWEDTTPQQLTMDPAPLQLMPPEVKPVSDGFDSMSERDQDLITRPDNWPSVFEIPNKGEGDALGTTDKTAEFLNERVLPKENVLLRDGGVIGASAVYLADELAKLAGGHSGGGLNLFGGDGGSIGGGSTDGDGGIADDLMAGGAMGIVSSVIAKYGAGGLLKIAGGTLFKTVLPFAALLGSGVLIAQGLNQGWDELGEEQHENIIAVMSNPEATIGEKATAAWSWASKLFGGSWAAGIKAGKETLDQYNSEMVNILSDDSLSGSEKVWEATKESLGLLIKLPSDMIKSIGDVALDFYGVVPKMKIDPELLENSLKAMGLTGDALISVQSAMQAYLDSDIRKEALLQINTDTKKFNEYEDSLIKYANTLTQEDLTKDTPPVPSGVMAPIEVLNEGDQAIVDIAKIEVEKNKQVDPHAAVQAMTLLEMQQQGYSAEQIKAETAKKSTAYAAPVTTKTTVMSQEDMAQAEADKQAADWWGNPENMKTTGDSVKNSNFIQGVDNFLIKLFGGNPTKVEDAVIFKDGNIIEPSPDDNIILQKTEPTIIDKSMTALDRPEPRQTITKQDNSGEKSLSKFDSMIDQLQEITKVLKDKNFGTSINSSYQAAPDFSQVRV